MRTERLEVVSIILLISMLCLTLKGCHRREDIPINCIAVAVDSEAIFISSSCRLADVEDGGVIDFVNLQNGMKVSVPFTIDNRVAHRYRSCDSEAVGTVWAWLERNDVGISIRIAGVSRTVTLPNRGSQVKITYVLFDG